MAWDDYRYSDEAREINLKIRWQCNNCGDVRESWPGENEGGDCYNGCGGFYEECGESYDAY